MAENPLDESRLLLHVMDGRLRGWSHRNPAYTHPANCLLGGRLGNGLGGCLTWRKAGLGHHTRQPHRWSVHSRCPGTSCCSPFRQPPTRHKSCVHGWQHQTSSLKGSNYLQNNVVMTLPWPAFMPDMNLLVHIWDILGHRIQAIQNLRELECIGSGCSCLFCWSDIWLERWDSGWRPSSEHVEGLLATEALNYGCHLGTQSDIFTQK